MAAIVLKDCQVYVEGHDFTGDSNQATMNAQAEVQPVTNFGSSGWDEFVVGVRSAALDVSGFWQAGDNSIDATEWAADGNTGRVVTFVPPGTTEGEAAAYMFQMARTSYSILGPHGEVAPFDLSAVGSESDGLVRGQLLLTKTASISSTGAVGTSSQIGAVAADEYLYFAVHLFPTAGTSITLIVESDDNGGFTSATTRATTGSLSAAGGTWVTRVAGPITDDYWRVNVSAVSGSWTAAAAVGIQ